MKGRVINMLRYSNLYVWKKVAVCFIFSILIGGILSGCNKKDSNLNKGVQVISASTFQSDSGILYNDSKDYIDAKKCYFDKESKENIYFCSKPNCDHTSLDCSSKAVRQYNFIQGYNQYYILNTMETRDTGDVAVSYLVKNDISNTNEKYIVKMDGIALTDIYLVDNVLYVLMRTVDIEDGLNTSFSKYYLYKINMKSYKTDKVLLREGDNLDILSQGLIDNKIILYYRYMEKIIDPRDYGKTGTMEEFMQDKESYKTYMEEVLNYFHEGMAYIELTKSKMVDIDLPTPLLIYRDIYYYNEKNEAQQDQLIGYHMKTMEKTVVYPGAVSKVAAVGDTLFIKEGIWSVSQNTFQDIIIYDKSVCKEVGLNLITGEIREVLDEAPVGADFDLMDEYEGYYIIIYYNKLEGIISRVGYIKIEDYYNGKKNFVLVNPF